MSVWIKFRSSLRSFGIDCGGNVALIFALATIPIILGVGCAIDYSRANSVQVKMQGAMDSVALKLASEAPTDTPAQLQQNAFNYFNALFTDAESKYGAKNVTVNATYSAASGTSINVSASADVPTTILAALGKDTITVSASNESTWGTNRLRVALVLDNTGSMADSGKITALKTATNNLLTQLQNAVSVNGDVYVSITPFVKDVNVGSSEWNSDWIYWGTAAQDPTLSDNNSWDANNGSCSTGGSGGGFGGGFGGGGGSSSPRSTCLASGTCSISGYTSQSSCTAAGTCSISGHSTQSSCTAAGTCSISGRTTQSSCTTASCSISGYTSQSSCTSAGTCSISGYTTQSSCQSAGKCSISQYTSSSTCSQHHGTWTTGTWTAGVWTAAGTWTTGTWTAGVWTPATWTPANHSTWNGCVMDRGFPTTPDTTNNYDTNVAPPTVTQNSSLWAAEQYSSCPQAAMGLSYDWSAMTDEVNNMSPAGNTNQAIGLELGWLSLVGGGPFTAPPFDPNYQYSQFIILLTDGLNTQDRWYSVQSQIDARQTMTCNNIKAAGIIIYTIEVSTDGTPVSPLLQNCASNSSNFYYLTSSSQIITIFNQIGTALTQLRLAK